MGRSGNFASIRTVASVIVAGATIISLLSCTDVRLQGFRSAKTSRLSGGIDTTLPVPVIAPAPMRVLFFVDQSYSMLRARCPQDLDNPNEGEISNTGDISTCGYEPGIDPEAHRYDAIDKWIAELTDYMKGNLDTDNVKIAIIPFSGGKYERPSIFYGDDTQNFQFKNLRDAKEWLTKLRREHDKDLSSAKQNWSPEIMGTTVPIRTLDYARSTLMNELYKLKAADPEKLKITPFHFVYLSDGVYKPISGYLEKAQRLIGCKDCRDPANRNDPSCTPPQGVCTGGECPYDYCNITVPKEFRLAFGDHYQNNTDLIARALKDISSYQGRFETGTITLNLIKIHPDRIKDEDKDSPIDNGVKNIFNSIYQKVPEARKFVLTSGTPPFSLVGGGAFLSYRLEDFYVVNLNAYVSVNGKLVVDSDGDGIPDEEEALSGSNPQKYRSDGSLCADGITKNYGCRAFGCKADYDEDGDSLSECDEGSFGSDSHRVDADADHVLDFFESSRRLNPNASEATMFTAGERYNDLTHFFAGVHPKWMLSKTPAESKIDVKIVELGYETVPGAGGAPVSVAKYNIRVNNVPLRITQAATGVPPMHRDPVKPEVTPLEEVIGPTDHGAGVNQVVMLAKVVANENPEISYWLLYRKEIKTNRDGQTFTFDVDFSKFHQLNLKERVMK